MSERLKERSQENVPMDADKTEKTDKANENTDKTDKPARQKVTLKMWIADSWLDVLLGAAVGAAITVCVFLNLPPPEPWYKRIF